MIATTNLGTFDGPTLLFGGPYSNLQATEAVLDEAERRDIPASRVICTGDVVAYCGDPRETVDRVRASGINVVMGNCEESLGWQEEDCGCGFEEGSSCDLLSVQWYAFANKQLSPDQRSWMRGLPRSVAFRMANLTLKVVHGGVEQINRFIFPGTRSATKTAELELAGVDGVIGGHSGLPFTQRVGRRLWHNPGVIGLPANDGTPRVWFSILTPTGSAIRIEHLPLDYDWRGARESMQKRTLPPDYARALASGLWPSLDILPEDDRARCGEALEPVQIRWPA